MNNNTDLIKKYKLEEAIKRIQRINEYSFYETPMVEDDEDPNAQVGADMGGGMPTMDGSQGVDQNMNGGA